METAMGFWNFLKKAHKINTEIHDKDNENYINTNPTDEQLKDNKNGTSALILSILSGILLTIIISLIVMLFANNIVLGIFSICLLIIPARMQFLALKKAKKQLNINGNGKVKFLLVKFVFPIIFASLSAIALFSLIYLYLK